MEVWVDIDGVSIPNELCYRLRHNKALKQVNRLERCVSADYRPCLIEIFEICSVRQCTDNRNNSAVVPTLVFSSAITLIQRLT